MYAGSANWIWSPSWGAEDKEEPQIMLFRKTVVVKGQPSVGIIRISADTKYKLYINGKFVEMGPSRGDNQVWFYDTVSPCAWMKRGVNVLAVMVLRYPEAPEKGNHGMFRTALPGLTITGSLRDEDGNMYDLKTDETWKCKAEKSVSFVREEVRFAPLMIHEKAQGNPEIFGWKTEYYDDSIWEDAKPYTKEQIEGISCLENMQPRTIPFLYRKKRMFKGIMDMKKSVYTKEQWCDFLHGKAKLVIPAGCEEVVEIDAGEEMTGYLKAGFSGGMGAEVHFLYAEAYVQDGVTGPEEIPVKGDRTDYVNGHLQGYEDIYRVCGLKEFEKIESTGIGRIDILEKAEKICVSRTSNQEKNYEFAGSLDKTAQNGPGRIPESEEIYEPYWFRTFRFIQMRVTTKEEPLTLCFLHYEETGYPLEVKTAVETSDESLKDIWEISERTLRRCMHETYEDCPFYEQLQYIMDARQQILYTYAVSADDRLARKCIDDMRRAQRTDGLLNCSYPNCNVNVIPTFSIYYIFMLYDHVMYFGDKKLVTGHIPTIRRILAFFDSHLTTKGYVDTIGGRNIGGRFWSFIDWAAEWNDTDGMPSAGLKGPLTMESLLYLYGLQHAAKLMEYAGQGDDAEYYTMQAENLKKAVVRHCTGKDNMLQDSPGVEEYSQHCQVFGILTGALPLKSGREILLKTVEDKQNFTQCTVAMSFYLFRALQKTGLYAYTNRYWDVWRRMLANHCTTCVEAEAYARSECHGWGALVLYELPSVSLGVTPAEPGYGKIRIAPTPGYLIHASGVVRTLVGDVKVAWEIKNGAFSMEYEAPEGVEVIAEEPVLTA